MKEGAKPVIFALLAWFCFALAVGASRKFHYASAPGVAATVWTLTALTLLVCWKIRIVRDWITIADLRWLIAVHFTRFVGIYFLILGNRGDLPEGFAKPAGIGDILIGNSCFGLATARPKNSIDLEYTRFARYHFRRIRRTAIWIERLAIDGAAACTSAQPFADLYRSADYRVTHFDLRSA